MQLNRTDAAAALGVAATTLDAWVRDGAPVLHRSGKGNLSSYDLPALVGWRVRSETERALGRAERKAKAEDLDAIAARRLDIEADRAALDLARARGELAPVSGIAAALSRRMIAARAALMEQLPEAIEAELSRDPAARPRDLVRREAGRVLASLSAELTGGRNAL